MRNVGVCLALLLAIALPRPMSAADETDAVVLLHGLGRGPWGMKVLEWRLEHAGYRVHSLGYDSRADSIETAARRVHEQIRSCCESAAQVHFVTHSLGAIVLRTLLAEHTIPNAGRAVLLAPPNRGSEIVDWFGDSSLLRLALGPLAPQLGTHEAQLPRRVPAPDIPFGVIAGSRWWNPLGALLLPGPHDGTVSVASTRLEGMRDHLVVPRTHTFIMNSRSVAQAIDRFLETGSFD